LDLISVGGATLERARDPNSPFFDRITDRSFPLYLDPGPQQQPAPFDDVRVRQAFNYALDKEQMVELFLQGNGLVARGALPPTMPGYGLSAVSGYPYDPERARQLLLRPVMPIPPNFLPSPFTRPGIMTSALRHGRYHHVANGIGHYH
jgi:ABC-type oligopeptide transport system substrate-binding subunit